jgi:hypothetical protein
MPATDLAIGPGNLPTGAPILKKPPYLITLEKRGTKGTATEKFISLDKPEMQFSFVQVKGFYCDKDEEDIVKGFAAIVAETPKDMIVEMMFPSHRVVSIRSLVFNAVKAITGK